MNRKPFALALLLALPGAPACSDSTAVQRYCEAYWLAQADRDVRCGAPQDVAAAARQPYLERVCPVTQSLVTAGQLAYDPAAGERCLGAVRLSGCVARAVDGVDPCAQALVGQVPAGGGCWDGQECAPGTVCRGKGCPGVCVALPRLGEACTSVGACAQGAWCVGGTCVPEAAAGAACGLPENPECGAGLWCGALSGRCRLVQAVTAGPCEGPADCAPGWSCQGLAQGGPGTCALTRAEGESCAGGDCASGLSCEAARCTPLPRLGEACDLGGPAPCAWGVCARADGGAVCRDWAGKGEPCEGPDACGPLDGCDAASRTCKPVRCE